MTRPLPPFEAVPTEQLLGSLNAVERKHAPATLYYAGDRTLLQTGRRVSIVGSRKASVRGLADARDLASALVAQKVTVVSGLAAGIDTAALEGTLEAGGRTIGVIGTALDTVFPAQNRQLQDQMMRDHLVVSQFPSGVPVRRRNFPIRNRTMALVSDATVIVEAQAESGSLHQAWEALRLGRPLFIFESNFKFGWPDQFEQYGAQILDLSWLEILLEALPETARGEVPRFVG